MIKTFETNHRKEKAVLVALINQFQTDEMVREYLDELAFLATTLGVETLGEFTQRLEKPDVATFVRKGKLEEIK
ncbi:MAG TPA: GTPase HflX, partial [Cyclobacteriaceae bacterium]